MQIEALLEQAVDTMTVRRVFGEPYEKNGVTFIPAAAVRGGGGGGGGEATESLPGGGGAGFGVTARPVGAYRIVGDDVTWIPAADATRLALMAEVGVIVALLVVRSLFRRRS